MPGSTLTLVADSMTVESSVIDPANAEMLRTVASRYVERRSCSVIILARTSATAKLVS